MNAKKELFYCVSVLIYLYLILYLMVASIKEKKHHLSSPNMKLSIISIFMSIVWFILLCNTILCIYIYYILYGNKYYSYICIIYYTSIDGHLGLIYSLAIVFSSTVNIECRFLSCLFISICLEYILRKSTDGSFGSYKFGDFKLFSVVLY